MTVATKVKTETEKLREELDDLKAGRAAHVHNPRDGTASFRCTSPYCDDLGSSECMGPPPNYAPTEKYKRG
jgi:hypothetical protein